MHIDFTQLVLGILGIIVDILALYAIPHFRAWLKAKVGEQNYKIIMKVVKAIVKAMEQQIQGSGRGAERKAEAMRKAMAVLEAKGIHVDEEELNDYIEAAVLDLKKEIEDDD